MQPNIEVQDRPSLVTGSMKQGFVPQIRRTVHLRWHVKAWGTQQEYPQGLQVQTPQSIS